MSTSSVSAPSTTTGLAVELLQLHRPIAESSGLVVCAESCRQGNHGAGDVQSWPCTTAERAIAVLEAAAAERARLARPALRTA